MSTFLLFQDENKASFESSSYDEVQRMKDNITHKISQNSKDSFSKNSGSLVNEVSKHIE